jgi:ATP synthase F1 complex assembly factor 1
MLTYLEDFKRHPLIANPYLVLTCFDELVPSKDLALLRGDVISHMSRLEGAAIMEQVLSSYLMDSEYETVRQFNFEP